MKYVDICIRCEKIPTTKLINTSIISQIYLFFFCENA